MPTAPSFDTSASRIKPKGPSRHQDYNFAVDSITDARKVFRVPTSNFVQGYQLLLKLTDNSTLDVLTVRLWGVKDSDDLSSGIEDLEVLLYEEAITLSNPPLPSLGAVAFAGETIQTQDPWGKYNEILVDIDATGSTGIDYDARGVLTSYGE